MTRRNNIDLNLEGYRGQITSFSGNRLGAQTQAFNFTTAPPVGVAAAPPLLRIRFEITLSRKPSRPSVCGPPLSFTIRTAPSRWCLHITALRVSSLTCQHWTPRAWGYSVLTSSYANITAFVMVASLKNSSLDIASLKDRTHVSLYCAASCANCCCCAC